MFDRKYKSSPLAEKDLLNALALFGYGYTTFTDTSSVAYTTWHRLLTKEAGAMDLLIPHRCSSTSVPYTNTQIEANNREAH